MDSNERIKQPRKTVYILLLIGVALLLIFGVYLLVGRANTKKNTLEADASGVAISEDLEEAETPNRSSQSVVKKKYQESTDSLSSKNGTIRLTQPHIYLRISHEQKLPLKLSAGVTISDLTCKVGNTDIVDVTDGVITGLEAGECNITISYGSESVQLPVTIRELNVVDECTYVDGILIANKSYGMPKEYNPGMLPVTAQAFAQLKADASVDGLNIYEGSGYRDYEFQVKCYESIVSAYGKEYADTYSARPGYSEHQTGYTIDCNTINDEFGETDEGKWLAENCHKYGFIIRYPKGKENITGYSYESWHIRYVGVEDATAMYEQGLTLEEYLDVDSVYRDE
ncbi:MAG: M15 family metallopeptidase [Oscillospiraceae bacterium]